MSYLIALGIGVLLGIIITCVLLSPPALQQYESINHIASNNWEAMKRAKEAYLNEEDTEEGVADSETVEYEEPFSFQQEENFPQD